MKEKWTMTVATNETKMVLEERIYNFYKEVGSLYDLVLNVDNFIKTDAEKYHQFARTMTNPAVTYEKSLELFEEYKDKFEEPEKAKEIVGKLGEYKDIFSLEPEKMDEETYKQLYATVWGGFIHTSMIPFRNLD